MNEAVKDGRLHHMDVGDIAQTSKTVKAFQFGDVYALPQLPWGKKNTQQFRPWLHFLAFSGDLFSSAHPPGNLSHGQRRSAAINPRFPKAGGPRTSVLYRRRRGEQSGGPTPPTS
ncbi:hypothetical protein FALCPG4_006154 [Fusarium falciforme]